MHSPTEEEIGIIALDIRNRVKECRKNPRWIGGIIPSNHPGYYANVGPDGHFTKIYHLDGERKDYFDLKPIAPKEHTGG